MTQTPVVLETCCMGLFFLSTPIYDLAVNDHGTRGAKRAAMLRCTVIGKTAQKQAPTSAMQDEPYLTIPGFVFSK